MVQALNSIWNPSLWILLPRKHLMFCIWIFFFLTRRFCFFSLVRFVAFSSFDFLWHATDYWHSNVNENFGNKHSPLHLFCTQRNDEEPIVGWNSAQMHPKLKSGWKNQKTLDQKFDWEQNSFNFLQHEFCLFLLFL